MAGDRDAHRVTGEGADWDLSPEDPDYDLSEAVGYAGWESRRSFPWPQWLIAALALLLILAVLLPIVLRLI
jgi:hypothetical protein